MNTDAEGQKSSRLLPHESIICGSMHHQQDMNTEEYVLTNDGYIAKYHEHEFEGITQLFRMLHVSEIKTIELDHSPANRKISVPYFFFLIIVGSIFAYLPFRFGVEYWWNGSEIDYVYSEWLGMLFVFSILIAMVMYANSRKLRLSPGTEVSIGHDSGKLKFADRQNTFLFPGLYFLGSIFHFLATQNGASWIGEPFPEILILIPIVIVLTFFSKRQMSLEIHSNHLSFTKREYPKVSMKEFGEKMLELLDLSVDADGIQHTIPLSKKYATDLIEINEQLDRHEEMLRSVGVRIKESLDSQHPWVGVVTIRVALEALLAHRVREINPKRKNYGSGVKDYVNALKTTDDSFEQEQYHLIEIIRTTGNAPNHGSLNHMTKHDYIGALRKFCTLVEWHFENPPTLYKVSEL